MNSNFQDYVTSGAFNMSLSRTQVSALSMLSEIGDAGCQTFSTVSALWRKGLIASTGAVESDIPSGPVELSAAGHHVMALVRMAGLTNAPASNYDTALDDRMLDIGVLADQNRRLADCILDLSYKLRAAENLIDRMKTAEGSSKIQIVVTGYDPDKNRCTCEAVQMANEVLSG